MQNYTRKIFPTSTSLLDWPKIEGLRVRVAQLVWREEASPAEVVWALGQVLAMHLDRVNLSPDDRRRLVNHFCRSLVRVDPVATSVAGRMLMTMIGQREGG